MTKPTKSMLAWLLSTLVLVVSPCTSVTPAQQSGAPSAKSENESESPEVRKRRESFELVWQTVNKSFYDPNFNGVDWNAIHDRYAPLVARTTSDQELHRLLQEMVNELHRSHFVIIPQDAIPKLLPNQDHEEDQESAEESDSEDTGPVTPLDRVKRKLAERLSTGIGIDVRVLNGSVLITRVQPSSAAARAGLRPGFVIKSVDGMPLSRVIADLEQNHVLGQIIGPAMPMILVAAYINGDLLNAVRLTYLDGRNLRREVRIKREKLNGEMSPAIGNLPPLYADFEARRLAGGIGYIRFNAFVPMLMRRVCAALREMHDTKGIVIDLRGNQGGLLGMISGLGGLLAENMMVFGSMKTRTGQSPVVAFPQRAPYTGALAILVDGSTLSAAEIFAAGMQETGRAALVGETSAGSTLPSAILKLPTGALFQYAFGNYQSPAGTFLEGRGVVPDWIVRLNRRALLRGNDPQLTAGIEKLRHRIALRGQKELIADLKVPVPDAKSADKPARSAAPSEPPPPPPKPLIQKPEREPQIAKLPADPKVPSVEQIVNHYIEAVGGEGALRKLTSRVSTGSIEIGASGLSGTVEIYEQAPNRLSLIMTFKGFGIVQQTFNGRVGWLQDPVQGYIKLPEPAQESPMDGFHRELGLKTLLDSLSFERKDKVGDRDCFVLDWMSGGIVMERFYFDVETGLLVRQDNTYLEDYREVDGVKLAFVARQDNPDGFGVLIKLKDIAHNMTIDEAKFSERSDCFTNPSHSQSSISGWSTENLRRSISWR